MSFVRSFLIVFLFGYSMSHGQINTAEVVSTLRSYYPHSDVPGASLIFIDNDSVVVKESVGTADFNKQLKINSETLFRLASVSKHFTAFAIFSLIEKGDLAINRSIGEFFPDLDDAIASITIDQLLNHTSGIYDYEELIPKNQSTQLLDADVLELIKPVETTYFEPGTEFRYSNTGYCLLALIVEKISSQSYAHFIRDFVFLPAGLTKSRVYEEGFPLTPRAFGYHPKEDEFLYADQSITSATKGDGGVYTSSDEFGLWVLYLMEKLKKEGAYWNFIQENKVKVVEGLYYSAGWFVSSNDKGNVCLFHTGESTGFHNIAVLELERAKALALFSNRDDLQIAQCSQQILELVDIDFEWLGKEALFMFLNRIYAHSY